MESNMMGILDNIIDGFMILDNHWKFRYLNNQAEKILGQDKSQLIGKNIWEEYPILVGTSFYNQHLSVMKDKKARTIIDYLPQLDSWLDVRVHPDKEKLVVYFRDITEEKKNQLQLHQSTERFKAIFENSALGLGIMSLDGVPLEINDAFANMIGYTKDEICNMKFTDYTHPDDIDGNVEIIKKLIAKEIKTYKIDKRFICKNGEVIWVRITSSLLCDLDGNPQYVMSVMEDITNMKIAEVKQQEIAKEWERLSSLDGLTGINNRRFFDELIKKEWSNCTIKNSPLSLILIDIDFFKDYNDTYGHIKGDSCLKIIAKTIQNSLREEHNVCRYGGEEFAVVLPEINENQAFKIGERLRKRVEDLKIPHNTSERKIVTISLGVATMIPDEITFDKMLVKRADTALYKAKLNGKNQLVVVD